MKVTRSEVFTVAVCIRDPNIGWRAVKAGHLIDTQIPNFAIPQAETRRRRG